jgi:8-oxo-dGTP pyrophosphatase MutT (NUDIX family)
MVAASILPVSIHKGKLYFLFGKENELEDSAKGFSDFGGRVENQETIYETALREGTEELSGFLGNAKQLKQLITKNGGVYKCVFDTYHVHIFFMEYDENLVKYFNQQHKFLWSNMDIHMLNDSKLFEKQELKWFSLQDMKTKKHLFRPFYVKMVEHYLKESKKIMNFIQSKKGSRSRSPSRSRYRSTRKIRGG